MSSRCGRSPRQPRSKAKNAAAPSLPKLSSFSGTPQCMRFGLPAPLSYANSRESPVAPSGKSAGERDLTVVLLGKTALDPGTECSQPGQDGLAMALAELTLFGGFELRRC